MKHKTAELSGALLDFAVAKAEGHLIGRRLEELRVRRQYAIVTPDGKPRHAPSACPPALSGVVGRAIHRNDPSGALLGVIAEKGDGGYSPSSDWTLGGQIIERERIKLDPNNPRAQDGSGEGDWLASFGIAGGGYAYGRTPLIAAMRAYVASKLGEEVELP